MSPTCVSAPVFWDKISNPLSFSPQPLIIVSTIPKENSPPSQARTPAEFRWCSHHSPTSRSRRLPGALRIRCGFSYTCSLTGNLPTQWSSASRPQDALPYVSPPILPSWECVLVKCAPGSPCPQTLLCPL